MTPNQQSLLTLLERAKQEGIDETLARQASTEDQPAQADDIPVHYLDGLPTREFFDSLSPEGYGENDYSHIWATLFSTDIDSGRSEMNLPYVVHGKGDKLLVACDDEPTQIVLPYKEAFPIFCLTPGKTYSWLMQSGAKVIKEGSFKVVGCVRWMKTRDNKYPHNMRDIGCPAKYVSEGGGIRYGRIYRAEHPDKIEVDSADHLYLRDQLGITVQLNLRDPKSDPARADLFEKTYSYNIPDYANLLTASANNKALFKSAFVALVKELQAGRNVLVNCWQGRDRTGTFCWFLQALCHMYPGYLQGHWELSCFDRCENSMIWEEGLTQGKLLQMTSKFKAKWGADPYKQALGLATLVGIPSDAIKAYQDIMMIPF